MKKTTLFITHDLDEAIRMGNRIAIMKDGAIVQIGTPEEIATNPADDYVTDFVGGISKLKLFFADTVMKPTEAYTRNGVTLPPLADCPTADPEDNLDVLVTPSGRSGTSNHHHERWKPCRHRHLGRIAARHQGRDQRT
ncbi:MAG: hypothetical protein ABJO75_26995 [Sedimentitalea sp.]